MTRATQAEDVSHLRGVRAALTGAGIAAARGAMALTFVRNAVNMQRRAKGQHRPFDALRV